MIGHTVHLFCPRPPKTVCTDTAHDAESGWKVVIILEAHHSLLPDQPPLASVQRCRILLLSRLNSACNASINGIDCVVFMLCVLHSKWIVYWPCTKPDVGQAATGRQEKMLKHFGSTTLGCSVLTGPDLTSTDILKIYTFSAVRWKCPSQTLHSALTNSLHLSFHLKIWSNVNITSNHFFCIGCDWLQTIEKIASLPFNLIPFHVIEYYTNKLKKKR